MLNDLDVILLLPLLHVVLLSSILLDEVFEHFLQSVRICLQCRQDVADRSLNEHAIDRAKALALFREWC